MDTFGPACGGCLFFGLGVLTFCFTFVDEVVTFLHPIWDAVNVLQVVFGDLMLFVLQTNVLENLNERDHLEIESMVASAHGGIDLSETAR